MKKWYQTKSFFWCAGLLLAGLLFFLLSLFSAGRSVLLFLSERILKPVLGFLPSLLPFSVFGVLIAVIGLALLILPVWGVISAIRWQEPRRFVRRVLPLLITLCVIAALYVPMWGIYYQTSNLGEKLGLAVTPSSADDLYQTGRKLVAELNEAAKAAPRDEQGLFTLTRSRADYLSEAPAVYERARPDYTFLEGRYSAPKPLYSFNIMNVLLLDGIYCAFTAEANVNTQMYPLLYPATILHEMAHQRGIAPENEANFAAFLIGHNAQDPSFRYSSLCLAFLHLGNALYSADPNLYAQLCSETDPAVFLDFQANNEFYDQFRGPVGEFSNSVNDTFLKANGEKNGTQSYGAVVDLLVAYYRG